MRARAVLAMPSDDSPPGGPLGTEAGQGDIHLVFSGGVSLNGSGQDNAHVVDRSRGQGW